MAIIESSLRYVIGDTHYGRPTQSVLAACQKRTPTIAEKAKVDNLTGQLHRAKLHKKDKHLVKALEQQIRNITYTF